jgi:CBS-domain-containing membrane protein
MSSAPIYRTDFPSLKGGDEVGEAMRRMLTNFVTDLPVVDDDGRLIGILKLERLLASLLPKGALIGFGMDDLSFVSDSLDHLRKQMQTVADTPVRQLMVKAEQVVHPDTSPVEIVLLLYRGASNVPVVESDTHKLVGMVSARDVLNALQN